MKAYSVKKASEILGVHWRTIKNWIYTDKIHSFKTPTGYHRIPENEIQKVIGVSDDKPIILYSRVSSYQQKDDLERQKNKLKESFKDKETIEIIDIASGLNDHRKGLFRALNLVKDQKAHKIVVDHRDRLTRFGFNYLELMITSWGGTIEVLDKEEPTQDLFRDLVEIMVSFCARIYGKRSNKNKARQAIKLMEDNYEGFKNSRSLRPKKKRSV